MNKRTIKQQARRIVESALDERGLYINENEYNERISQVFLGTVFNIMPSGKYYMPFACSNVESCARCKGEGCDFCGHTGSREAYEDELMIDSLEYYAQKTGGWIENGYGDPCDMFICWSEENEENEENEEAQEAQEA